jgi:hypothetical protein
VITQFRFGAIAMATALAMACGGDASAPLPPQMPAGSALARHMDSLVVAAKSNPRDSLWAAWLEGAEYVPAYGGAPASVAVRTDSGTATWQALVLAEMYPGQDTSYFLWAYSDSAFTKLLVTGSVVVPEGLAGVESYLIVSDTLVAIGSASPVITTTSVGDSCIFTFGLVNIPNVFAAGSCVLGTFTASVNVVFAGDTVAIAAQPVTGVILK